MLGLIRSVFDRHSRDSMPMEELDYLVSFLNTSVPRAHGNERLRTNVLSVARKVRDAVRSDGGSYSADCKRRAIVALNKVKIHALASGRTEDYKLFIQLDKVTRGL